MINEKDSQDMMSEEDRCGIGMDICGVAARLEMAYAKFLELDSVTEIPAEVDVDDDVALTAWVENRDAEHKKAWLDLIDRLAENTIILTTIGLQCNIPMKTFHESIAEHLQTKNE